MATSSRFAVAVHILSSLALRGGGPVRSEQIADSVNTNPTVVRRILSGLANAGITGAQLGLGGGATLAKMPEQITLLDVYRAVEDESLFSVHRSAPSEGCIVGRNVLPVLAESTCRAQRAMEAELARTTIADVARDIVARDGERGSACPR